MDVPRARSREVVLTCEPDGSEAAARHALLLQAGKDGWTPQAETEALLFVAARRYQAGADVFGDEAVLPLPRAASRPAATLVLDLPADETTGRELARDGEQRGCDRLDWRVRGFVRLLADPELCRVRSMDASGPVEAATARLLTAALA